MPDEAVISVSDNPAESRFEVTLNGEVRGYAVYEASPTQVVFTHTKIDPAAGGHGLGSRLAHDALESVRASGRAVIPICPFINAYIGKHPEYLDLVPQPYRDQVPPPA